MRVSDEVSIPVSADSTLGLTEYAGDLADFLEAEADRAIQLDGLPSRLVMLREDTLREIISELRRAGVIIER